MKKQMLLITAIMTLVVAPNAYAFIPPEDSCIDLKAVEIVRPYEANLFSKDNTNKILPTNMSPGTDPNLFLSQFETGLEQKITDSILNGDTFRQSSVGKMTTQVEKAAQTSVVLSPVGGMIQKIDFKIKAFQKQALLTYQGYFNSDLVYTMDQNNIRWVISKPLSKTTTVSWTNVAAPDLSNPSTSLSVTHTF